MPRSHDSTIVTAAKSAAYRAALAVEVGTSTPIRVTDCPSGCYVSGVWYPAGYLDVGEVTLDDQPAVSVRISNTANAVTSRDLDGTAQGGVIGKTLKVFEQYGSSLIFVTIYSGIVVGFTADQDSAEVLGSLAELRDAGMVGVRTTRLCSYKYGGARCGDTDGTSCDHTYSACTAHGNTARYGGFRTMPTLNTRLQYYLQEFVPGASRFGTAYVAPPPAPAYNPFAPPPRADLPPPRLHLKRAT